MQRLIETGTYARVMERWRGAVAIGAADQRRRVATQT